MLSDLRLTLEIFPRFEPNGRGRPGNIPLNEICIGERMEKWAMCLSRIGACIEPAHDIVNFSRRNSRLGGRLGRRCRPTWWRILWGRSLAASG